VTSAPARISPSWLAQAARAGLSRGGTTWMLTGSLIAGVGAYVFQVVGARSLGEVAYAPISVLWTCQYLLSSVVMTALESWVVRTVTSEGGRLLRLRTAAWALTASLLTVATLLTALVYLGQGSLLQDQISLVAVIPVLVASYACFVIVRGVLAARDRYKAYGGVTALESLIRLGAAVLIAVTIPKAAVLAWTLPLGAFGAAAWGVRTRLAADGRRETAGWHAPQMAEAPTRFLALTTSANAAAQLLLAGGALLLAPLGATPEQVSIFFVTITAARVPLVIVQGGLLSRLLPTFTRLSDSGNRARLMRTARQIVAATVVTSALSGLVAAAVGPSVIAALFGPGYAPTAILAAVVAAGVVMATGGAVVNQALVAVRREAAIVGPWLLGLAVALAAVALSAPLDPTSRVLLGFGLGETAALLTLSTRLRLNGRGPEWHTHPRSSNRMHADVRSRGEIRP
jgi:O-antigen/teichoic acid export membrane protein